MYYSKYVGPVARSTAEAQKPSPWYILVITTTLYTMYIKNRAVRFEGRYFHLYNVDNSLTCI